MRILGNVINIFRIRPAERRAGAIALAAIVALNILFVHKMAPKLTPLVSDAEMTRRVLKYFHISGFDPITLITVSAWSDGYNVYRHPLLAFLIYPLYALNQLCEWAFGIDCALFIVAVLMTVCAFYSFLFVRRIFTDVMQLSPLDANLLSALMFSFAYVMLITFIPDHFGFSMTMLLIVLCVAGLRIRKKKEIPLWQMVILYIFTTGVTTTNSVKIVLAQLFTNGWKRFFHPRNLLLGLIVPSLALWTFCQFEYKTFVVPQEKVKHAAIAKRKAAREQRMAQLRSEYEQGDSATPARLYKYVKPRPKRVKMGKPMKNEGFLKWTDVSTSRWQTVTENLFGESIQLHRRHLLGDVLMFRPMFVSYDWAVNYVAEGLLAVLFLAGIWYGRRSRFLWLALAWLSTDLLLHLGLGFGINEVYIMAPHWLFVIPISIGYILLHVRGRQLAAVRSLTGLLTLWFYCYNGWLLVGFILKPL